VVIREKFKNKTPLETSGVFQVLRKEIYKKSSLYKNRTGELSVLGVYSFKFFAIEIKTC
jgi:hypothetical protein